MRVALRLLVDVPTLQAGQQALEDCARAINRSGGTILARDAARQDRAFQVRGVDRTTGERWAWTGTGTSIEDAEQQAITTRGTASLVAYTQETP